MTYRLLGLTLVVLARIAFAADPVPQPAESAKERKEGEQPQADAPTREPGEEHQRSWEAMPVPETRVRAPHALKEEEAIGSYAQPRWTARRRFPTTRLYVVPEGAAQFEWWLETKSPLGDFANTRFRSLYELEFGLGHRLQLDLYLQTEQQGSSQWELVAEKVELRYALAKWGVIPANPTVYLEWTRQHDGVHKGEVKLLVGDELSPRWHWGANVVFESELFNATQEHEYAVTGALSYTVIDQRFSVGGEVKVELVDERERRLAFKSYEILAGPSIQWRPVKAAHIDLVALFGVESERDIAASSFEATALLEPTVIIGWEF